MQQKCITTRINRTAHIIKYYHTPYRQAALAKHSKYCHNRNKKPTMVKQNHIAIGINKTPVKQNHITIGINKTTMVKQNHITIGINKTTMVIQNHIKIGINKTTMVKQNHITIGIKKKQQW